MAAPVVIKNQANSGSGISGFVNEAHGIGAQANVFMMLVVFAQKNSTSPIAVTGVTDNVGNTWQRYDGQQNTALSANSPGPTNNTSCDQEVWWTRGSVTNGGSYSMTLDATADGAIWHFIAATGTDPTDPFDQNASIPAFAHSTSSANVSGSITSDTNNILAFVIGSRAANSDAGDPKFTTGAAGDGGSDRGNFSSTNNMRSKLRYKAFTSAVTALGAGYTAALSNGPVTNMNVMVFAITADSQAVNGTAPGSTVTVTTSLIAGVASVNVDAPGDTVTVDVSIIAGTASEITSLDGSRILEFTANIAPEAQFLSADYDSILSIGDRVTNGVIAATGDYGWGTTFGATSNLLNGSYASSDGWNYSAGDSTAGAAMWFTFGHGIGCDIRGLRFRGEGQFTNIPFWAFVGGVAPGFYWPEPYPADFDAFQIAQNSGPDAFDTYSFALPFSPRVAIPWPHYEFVLAANIDDAPLADRFANEIEIRVAHSSLDGGDRRPGTAAASKSVAFTMSSHWGFRTTGDFVDPADGLFDGNNLMLNIADRNIHRPVQIGTAADAGIAVSTVGAYLQFVFPRAVRVNFLVFQSQDGGEVLDSGGEPTLMGKWHWEISNNGGASYFQIGGTWFFNEAFYTLAGPFGLTTESTHWRMVLEEGPAFGDLGLNQVMFALDDPGDTGTPMSVGFTDDTDGELPLLTIANESPYVVRFSDGDDDGLDDIITITPNLLLTVDFTDDGGLTAFGTFYPSTFGQAMVIATGRIS